MKQTRYLVTFYNSDGSVNIERVVNALGKASGVILAQAEQIKDARPFGHYDIEEQA